MSEEMNIIWIDDDDIKYPYQFSGYTVYKTHFICNKCGGKVERGIINLSTHWNDCIDGGKTLSALTTLRKEKGSELTIEDIGGILK